MNELEKQFYLGNQNIKRSGVVHSFTEEQAREYAKCMKDPIYFINTYIKMNTLDHGVRNITLYPYQEKLIDVYMNNRFSIVVAPRQSSKCCLISTNMNIRNKKTGETLTLSIGELYERIECSGYTTRRDIIRDEATTNKITATLLNDEWEIETDEGYLPLTAIHKTIPFDVWRLETQNGCFLEGADTHIVFDSNMKEVFIKDLAIGTEIITRYGPSSVIQVEKQERNPETMYDVTVDSPNHRVYTNDILSHNTTSTCAFLLHFALFNTDKTITIFANKADTAREILDKIMTNLENLPFWLQAGVTGFNKSRIEFDNGSRILTFATTKSSARSYSSAIAYLDEFAWVDNDVEFYTSVYPIISSGSTSRIIISSSARNLNLFYKLVTDARQGKNSYKLFEVNWWDVPGRDQKWKEETIKNTSERQFDQEHGNKFLGSSGTLIPADVLEKIAYIDPISTKRNTYYYKKPQENRKYVATVDTAHGTLKDDSAISIFDVTEKPYEQVATFFDNTIAPSAFAGVVVNLAKEYNDAFIVVENNEIGGQVASDIVFDREYENVLYANGLEPGIKMTKKSKLVGCIALKELLSTEKMIINDFKTLSQLSCFIDKGGKYAADSNTDHDDLVMTLVLLAWADKTDNIEMMTDNGEKAGNNIDEPPDIMSSEDIAEVEGQLVDYKILSEEDFKWLFPNEV